MPDSPKDPGDVEITPEMMKAGGRLVDGYDGDVDNAEEVAATVYREMNRIRLALLAHE